MYWKLLHVRTSVWRAPPKHALDWLVAGCWHWGQSWAAVTSNTSPLPTSISAAITQYLHPLHLHPFSQHHAYISLPFSAVDSGQWTTNTEVCSSEECKQWMRRVAIVPGTPPAWAPRHSANIFPAAVSASSLRYCCLHPRSFLPPTPELCRYKQ